MANGPEKRRGGFELDHRVWLPPLVIALLGICGILSSLHNTQQTALPERTPTDEAQPFAIEPTQIPRTNKNLSEETGICGVINVDPPGMVTGGTAWEILSQLETPNEMMSLPHKVILAHGTKDPADDQVLIINSLEDPVYAHLHALDQVCTLK